MELLHDGALLSVATPPAFSRFQLDATFVKGYAKRRPKFGLVSGPNTVGEITFMRTYARRKPDGTLERWHEVCERVVNGTYRLQQKHIEHNKLGWDAEHAQRSAQEMFDRMWSMKFLPPGRGLWIMGTDFIEQREIYAALQNCGFVSTENLAEDPTEPFCWLMDASMLGVGVGFDTNGAGTIDVHALVRPTAKPVCDPDNSVMIDGRLYPVYRQEDNPEYLVVTITDDREGWVNSLRSLLNAHFLKDQKPILFNYHLVRRKGLPIKGFGGTSSGPFPLWSMHRQIAEVLANGAGKPITIRIIVDIMNMIGACVVAGNVRRSAEISFGKWDSNEFINLKNVTDGIEPQYRKAYTERLIALKKQGNWMPSIEAFSDLEIPENQLVQALDKVHRLFNHGWCSNNSIFAHRGMDYGPIAERIRVNGEPGLAWLENMRAYSRMCDPPDNKDYRVKGANPCVPADTWIMTDQGPRQVRDLIDTPFTALVDGKPYSSSAKGFFATGHKPLYRLTTEDGYTVELTGNHQVKVVSLTVKARRTSWVEAKDITPGMLVSLDDHRKTYWVGTGNYYEGWLLGSLLGDGHLTMNKARLEYWGTTRKHMLEYAKDCMAGAGVPCRSDSGSTDADGATCTDRDYAGLGSVQLAELAKTYEIVEGKSLSPTIEKTSSAFHVGFLRGWFDADGSVQGNQKKGVSVRLTSVKLDSLTVAQRMLARLGIISTIYPNRVEAGMRPMPDGKGGQKDYFCQASHELVIANENVRTFHDVVGFADPEKTASLYDRLQAYRRDLNRERFAAKVLSCVPTGTSADVFDCTIEHVHEFDANGIGIHNCVEQSLEDHECCTLVETFPHRHESREDYLRTLKFAYLYAKTVTLGPTHWPKTNKVMARNRRIGCSMSGVAQFTETRGLAVLTDWCKVGYREIEKWDVVYSEWLGVPLSRKKTSIKPSGCRPWNALTSTDKGLLTLEELFESHPEGETWAGVAGVRAVNTSGTLKPITKTYVNGVSETVKITLSYGLELVSTPNHQWFVKSRYEREADSELRLVPVNQWVAASDLQDGDVLDVVQDAWAVNSAYAFSSVATVSLSMRGDAVRIVEPPVMTEDIAWFLGYLWGDGAMSPSKYRVRFIDEHQPNLQRVIDIAQRVFGLTTTMHRASQTRNAWCVELSSKHLWHWLIRNGVYKYFQDRLDLIPRCVRGSRVEHVLAFVAGLIDADGCTALYKGTNASAEGANGVVSISTADTQFADHLQHVLWATGLVCGRSLNQAGANFQNHKSMWNLALGTGCSTAQFDVLRRNSWKCQRLEAHPEFRGWRPVAGKSKLIVGKVVSVEDGPTVPTYDVEVAESHWYYAGAVKSHNTVSKVVGASPGAHFPIEVYSIIRIRFANDDPLLAELRNCGYYTEPAVKQEETTSVVEIPCYLGDDMRTEAQVSIWEQVQLACHLQAYWADNQVSFTGKFDPATEGHQLATLLSYCEDKLKGISMLPKDAGEMFAQMPNEILTKEQYHDRIKNLKPVNFDRLYDSGKLADGVGERFCSTDKCELVVNNP